MILQVAPFRWRDETSYIQNCTGRWINKCNKIKNVSYCISVFDCILANTMWFLLILSNNIFPHITRKPNTIFNSGVTWNSWVVPLWITICWREKPTNTSYWNANEYVEGFTPKYHWLYLYIYLYIYYKIKSILLRLSCVNGRYASSNHENSKQW